MRIRVFDITWRMNGPGLPKVIENDFVLDSYVKNHPKHIGEPLRRFIHHAYYVNPVFFKYVMGNSPRVYTYEYTDMRNRL